MVVQILSNVSGILVHLILAKIIEDASQITVVVVMQNAHVEKMLIVNKDNSAEEIWEIPDIVMIMQKREIDVEGL